MRLKIRILKTKTTMDGWGSLTMLIKRQEAAKFRKAILRNELKRRKESYLHDTYNGEDVFDFPKVSEAEMAKIKYEIRKKLKRERKIQWIFSALLFITILFVMYLIFYK